MVKKRNINDPQYNKWFVKTISNGRLTTSILFPIRRGRCCCLRRNGQCISSFCNDTFREFGFLALKSFAFDRVGQSRVWLKLASWNSPALLLYARECGHYTWKIYWTCLNHNTSLSTVFMCFWRWQLLKQRQNMPVLLSSLDYISDFAALVIRVSTDPRLYSWLLDNL